MINFCDKERCCACGACVQKCEMNAITMAPDKYGNYYPNIDKNKCIECGLCENVCPMIHTDKSTNLCNTYAVQLKSNETLRNSASGGAFFAMAECFINNGGIVCGCAYDDKLIPTHISIVSRDQLRELQGSKYVRSTVEIYNDICEYLKKGKAVLFSGTPCQCQAVRLFCKKFNTNLFTVELICHGVIDKEYWMDYIHFLESKHSAQILTYVFRSKKRESGFISEYRVRYSKPNLIFRKNVFYETQATSYYYNHFLKGKVYRECCYRCPYACNHRASDVTIGDYWGYRGTIDKVNGISAVIVNSEKGQVLFDSIKKVVNYEEQTFENIVQHNEQLKKPYSIEKKDYTLLEDWKKYGAKYLDERHQRQHWKAYLLSKFGVIR